MSANPYDEVPYPSGAFPQTHPARLAALGRLFGMTPAPVARCRVLELGSATGGNLLPLAEALPQARFVGIDLSARAIEAGREQVARLGLDNLELRLQDLLDFDPEPGGFDYVICHGVYSWVPAPVRDRVLWVCARALAPQGIAYVSYNTFPGCYFRRFFREMMGFHTRAIDGLRDKVAAGRELVRFLAESAPEIRPSWAALLRAEAARLDKLSDEVLLHDDLSEVNDPVYFHQFAAHAAGHRLQYLTEALYAETQGPPLKPGVRDRIEGTDDLVAAEQYLDLLRCRSFRQSLLCHASVPLARPAAAVAIRSSWIVSNARPQSPEPELRSDRPERFTNPSGVTIGLADPFHKAVLAALAARFPTAVSFDRLLELARESLRPRAADPADEAALEELLLEAFGGDMVEVWAEAPAVAERPGERPRASAVARLQAQVGRNVTNLWHRNVMLDEPWALHLLRHLDGTSDREELLGKLIGEVRAGALDLSPGEVPGDREGLGDPEELRRRVAERLESTLEKMARFALLIA